MPKKDKKNSKSTPKDVFLYLLMIAMLYVSTVSFLAIVFQYITLLIPDQLMYNYRTNALEAIKSASSALIVSFPVFILMSWFIGKDISKHKEKLEIGIRRWLVYLTLFIAAITIIIDLIVLVNNFYDGDLTTAFLLKTLAVLITAALIFGYYIWELNKRTAQTKIPKVFGIGTGIIVLATVIGGFFLIGTPQHQRDIRFDEDRVLSLRTIQSQLVNFWQQTDTLPDTLSELNDPIYGFSVPMDPKTNESFIYRKNSDLSFTLCATFATESEVDFAYAPTEYAIRIGNVYPTKPLDDNWSHTSGEQCFERTIDPERHKLPQ